MRNKKIEKIIEGLLHYSVELFKLVLMSFLVGIMGIMFYQAGRAEMLEMPENIDEICEQRATELKNPVNEFVLEKSKVNKGVTNEK